MEQLLHALKQGQAGINAPSNGILKVIEWEGMDENLISSLVDRVSDLESREKDLILVRELLDKRVNDLGKREKEFESFRERLALKERGLSPLLEDFAEEARLREEKLDEELKLVRDHIDSLEVAQNEVERLRLLEREKLKEIEKRERQIDSLAWSVEKRLRDVKQREKEFDSFQDEKLREIASKEEILSRKREEFIKEVELASEKLKEGDNFRCGLIRKLGLAFDMFEGMKANIDKRLKEIDSWETVAHKSLTARLNEADLIRESLEKRFKEFEEMEKEFNSFQEDKMQKLELKEQQLCIMRGKLLEEVKLRDDKLAERLKEIDSCETVANKSLTARLNEADLIRESLEKRFKELEEMEKEFNSFQEDKMQKLELKEQQLRIMRIELLKEVKLRDDKLAERFKEIDSCGTVANKSLTACLSEADLIRESLEKQFKEFEEMKKVFNSFQEEKMRDLELKEQQLSIMRTQLLEEDKLRDQKATKQQKFEHHLLECLEKMVDKKMKEIEARKLTPDAATNVTRESANIPVQELAKREKEFQLSQQKKSRGLRLIKEDLSQHVEFREDKFDKQEKAMDGLLERSEAAENNVKDVNAITSETFKEIGAKEIECNYIKDWVQREVDELELKAEELKEPEKGIKLDEDVEISKGLVVEPDEPVDLRRAEQDRKIMELFINNKDKDLEVMDDEVLKVLLMSPDPANLVLDKMLVFCTPYLREGDVKLNIQRKCILLLDQFTKMSPNIQPYVREAALKLANMWKSKMRTTAENPLDVLGFLHFLAAYNLSSCFDKDEIFGFLKKVAQHKQTPDLCRILGLTEYIPGFIQRLINEKQYLLASTYVYEFELENAFPQAAVLNYYVQHAQFSAKAKFKMERNPSEAQDKAITSEIADLRVAISHILKYGLESEFSPYILTSRIKQLEIDRARLRNRLTSSSRKWEPSKRFDRPHYAMKRKAREQQYDEAKEAAPAIDARFCRSKTYGVPINHLHSRANKWRRTNNLPYMGAWPQQGVEQSRSPLEDHVLRL